MKDIICCQEVVIFLDNVVSVFVNVDRLYDVTPICVRSVTALFIRSDFSHVTAGADVGSVKFNSFHCNTLSQLSLCCFLFGNYSISHFSLFVNRFLKFIFRNFTLTSAENAINIMP